MPLDTSYAKKLLGVASDDDTSDAAGPTVAPGTDPNEVPIAPKPPPRRALLGGKGAAVSTGMGPDPAPETRGEVKRGLGPVKQKISDVGTGVQELLPTAVWGATEYATENPALAGTTQTATDYLIGIYNHLVHGDPMPSLRPQDIAKQTSSNVVGGYLTEGAGKVVGTGGRAAGSRLLGERELLRAGQQQAEEATEHTGAFVRAQEDARQNAADQSARLRARPGGEVGEDTQALVQKHAQDAREATIQRSMGRTPEETRAAIAGGPLVQGSEGGFRSSPQMVARQQKFWGATIDSYHKIFEQGSADYDAFWKPHLNDVVPDKTALRNAAEQQLAYAASPAQALVGTPGGGMDVSYSGRVNDLIKRAQTLANDPNVTVNQLRGLRSDASRALVAETVGRNKVAAQSVIEGVDKTLDDSAVLTPGEHTRLDALNAHWRADRTLFDRDWLRRIGNAGEPTDVAKDIFGTDDPKRARLLLANASPEAKVTFRETYADAVNRFGAASFVKPEHAEFLREMFPGTPLADPQNFIHLDRSLTTLQDILNSSPEVREQFLADRKAAFQQIADDSRRKILAAADKEAGSMGKTGVKMRNEIHVAKTLQDKVNVATRYMTNGLDDRMAIQSIMSGQLKGQPTLSWMRRMWPLYLGIWGLGTVTDTRVSPYMKVAGSLGLSLSAVGKVRESFLNGLADNPGEAKLLWENGTTFGQPGRLKALAGLSARSITQRVIAEAGKNAVGWNMDDQAAAAAQRAKATPKTGAAIKDLDHSRARAAAPSPGATPAAERLSKDLHSGKPANVTNDLRSGRVSMDEVRTLQGHASKANVMALVDNVALPEVMNAMEIATPDEKQMLMPLLQQRIQREMPGIQNKTMQMKLAQRFQKLQQPERA